MMQDRCELQHHPDLEVTSFLKDDEICERVVERRSGDVRDHLGLGPEPSTLVSSTAASRREIEELYALIDSQQADIWSMRAELQELKERMTRVEDFVFGQHRGNESDSGLSSSTSCLD
ncbi:hypothetical protein BVC80_1811g10 [Macleaya cordata]|uniref:Uncharacterized protein n=1 Tax=Macleaya cordata TaxID=56857 RepID=A0A200QVS7_MACCD|nr:hypothetical protein BVC80_1811g10 [Macleaya cordata]